MLIRAGDGFDEADFNVAHGEHEEETCLEPVLSSRDSKHAPHLPNLEDSKAPQLRPHATRIDSAADKLRQSPSKHGPPNSAHPARPNEVRTDGVIQRHPERPSSLLPTAPLSRTSSNAILDPGGASKCLPEARFVKGECEPQNPSRDSILPFDNNLDGVDHAAPVGFYTARAAETVQSGLNLPLKAPPFNPHLESPSIRKTAGVDHTKTKPVGRDSIPASPSLVLPPRSNNFVNPQIDKNRKVGMPAGAAASPLQNRNSYKPLQIKRPAELDPAQLVLPTCLPCSNPIQTTWNFYFSFRANSSFFLQTGPSRPYRRDIYISECASFRFRRRRKTPKNSWRKWWRNWSWGLTCVTLLCVVQVQYINETSIQNLIITFFDPPNYFSFFLFPILFISILIFVPLI